LRFCQDTTEQETRRTKRDGLIDDEKQTNAHDDDLEMSSYTTLPKLPWKIK
jgi:hypothetical protein